MMLTLSSFFNIQTQSSHAHYGNILKGNKTAPTLAGSRCLYVGNAQPSYYKQKALPALISITKSTKTSVQLSEDCCKNRRRERQRNDLKILQVQPF